MPKGSFYIKPANISVILGNPISTLELNGKDGELELMEHVHQVIEKNYINQS